jgi:hypothetical protein
LFKALEPYYEALTSAESKYKQIDTKQWWKKNADFELAKQSYFYTSRIKIFPLLRSQACLALVKWECVYCHNKIFKLFVCTECITGIFFTISLFVRCRRPRIQP